MATLALVVTLALMSAARPPPAEFRKAFEANRDTLVEVRLHGHRTQGVLVGAQGQVLAALAVKPDQTVQVFLGARSYDATVLFTDASIPICLLAITPSGAFHAAAVRTRALQRGDWLVALSGHSKTVAPDAGQVTRVASPTHPWLETTFVAPVGSPLFDTSSRLAGVLTRRAGRALPIEWVRQRLSHPVPELP